MKAPGLKSLISFTNEKSPFILFLISRLRYSWSQTKLVFKVNSINIVDIKLWILSSHSINILMAKSFNYGLDKIADAFQKRAEELFHNR